MWAKALILVCWIVVWAVILRLILEAGYRWVDRMLHVEPFDPSKPVVRKLPE